jgi:alcohol dehydrogenase, propanol-preferring
MSSTMYAAVMREFNKPLVLEEVPAKSAPGEGVLVKVGGTGICRTDLQMIDGYFQEYAPVKLPVIPGHEIAGWVEEIGSSVPDGIIEKGDLVVVSGGWGCGLCPYCKRGDEQICPNGTWPGFGYNGGYSEFVSVPSYRYLIKIDEKYKLKPEEIAPLTDAGLTTYRAVKKARHNLGPGKSIGIMGMGGLGHFAIQYAKILSSGSTILAFDRNDDKLDFAKQNGADHVINIRNKKSEDIRDEVNKATGRKEIDVIMDSVGAEEVIPIGFSMLAVGGTYVSSGLVGTQIKIPLFPFVAKEYQYFGSFWGNYNDLREVIELAKKRSIISRVQKFSLSEVNEALDLLREGKIQGRGVLIPR